MQDIQLDARLGALMTLVGDARLVADIGADHGHLAMALLRQHSTRRVLVSDISDASLEKARVLLKGQPEEARTVFVVADGLSALSAMPDVEAIAIGGMGAGLIKQILMQGRDKIGDASLCLQPNRDIHFLRAWLQENGFALEMEILVRAAGRFYPLLRARRGKPARYTEQELFLGPLLLAEKPPLFQEYLSWKRDVLRHTLQGLRQSGMKVAQEKAEEIARHLRWVEEAMA